MRAFPLFLTAALVLAAGVVHAQKPTEHARSSTKTALIDTHAAPPVASPPATARHAASSTLHAITIDDPYRWLEHADDPAVQAVDRGAERLHRESDRRATRSSGAEQARAPAGDHLDHPLGAAPGRRHAVLFARDAAAAAAGAGGAGRHQGQAARAGGPERGQGRTGDHRLLALAQRSLPGLWHRRGRQRVDHHPRARREHRKVAGRRLAVCRRRHHAAGPGMGCRRTRFHLCTLPGAAGRSGGQAVPCRAGAPRAWAAGIARHGGVRQGLFVGGRIPSAELARRPAAGGAGQYR